MDLLLAKMEQNIRCRDAHRQPVHREDGGVRHRVQLALPEVGVADVGWRLRVDRVLMDVPLGWDQDYLTKS